MGVDGPVSHIFDMVNIVLYEIVFYRYILTNQFSVVYSNNLFFTAGSNFGDHIVIVFDFQFGFISKSILYVVLLKSTRIYS